MGKPEKFMKKVGDAVHYPESQAMDSQSVAFAFVIEKFRVLLLQYLTFKVPLVLFLTV